MQKRRCMLKKAAAVSLAAAMTVQLGAMAAPMDDLNAIMEKQEETESKSLLEETVGFDAIGEAIEENGMQLQMNLGLMDGTAQLLELPEEIADGAFLKLNTQVDPNLKKWLADLSAGLTQDSSLLDLSLYGDEEQLTLAIPQFFDGAVSLHAGSLAQQYAGSVLEQAFGALPADFDLDLAFYPEAGEESESLTTNLEKIIEDGAEKIGNEMTAEVREEDGQTVYTVTCQTKSIIDLYKNIIDEYFSILTQTGLMTSSDLLSVKDEMTNVFDSVQVMMQDEINIDFYVKDDQVTRLHFQVPMDVDQMQATLEDTTTGEEAATEAAAEAETEAAEAVSQNMTLDYDIVFKDPSNLSAGMDYTILGLNAEGQEEMNMVMSMQDTVTDTKEDMTMDLKLAEQGETIFDGRILTYTYDATTGDLDVNFTVDTEEESVALVFDSVITDVEKGKSFNWVINELSMKADDETIGLKGNVAVTAEAGEITAPQDPKEILKLTEAEFSGLMMQIQTKATTWAQQFMPETETIAAEDVQAETELAEVETEAAPAA